MIECLLLFAVCLGFWFYVYRDIKKESELNVM